MYVQDFIKTGEPEGWIYDVLAGSVGTVTCVNKNVSGCFGYKRFNISGAGASGGHVFSTELEVANYTVGQTFGGRFFNLNHSKNRWHVGLFATRHAHEGEARAAFCNTGSKFAILTTTPSANSILSFAHTPLDGAIYNWKATLMDVGMQVSLYNGDGTLIETKTKSNDLPSSQAGMYFGAVHWAGETLVGSESIQFGLDKLWFDAKARF